MTVFVTKVWGFDEPCGPLVFNSEGWRDNAIKALQPGDRVVLVGTLNKEPAPEDIGRLLGMMEPTTTLVSALDYPIRDDRRNKDADGGYRWPFGLMNTRAWAFIEKPTFAELVKREFHTNAAVGIVPLSNADAEVVMAQPHREVPLLRSVQADKRHLGETAAMRRGAPPPSTTRAGVMHMRNAPAFTYMFALDTSDDRPVAYKIGWAFNWKRRLREFNKVAGPMLGGLTYRAVQTYLWESAREAFRMEQHLLAGFDDSRHAGNREVLSGIGKSRIEEAWTEYVRIRKMGR